MQEHHLLDKSGSWDLEIGSPLPLRNTSRRRSWQRQANNIPRWLKLSIIAVVTLCASAGLLRGFGDLHDQAVKQYPTDFEELHRNHSHLSLPESPIRHRVDGRIDSRYAYIRQLAKGQEGSAALYTDSENGNTVVVKTFNIIARNRLPESLHPAFADYAGTWPAEIEAAVLLSPTPNTTITGFVPVLDYFILQTSSGWFWALVTPYISTGTLLSLAHTLPPSLSPSTLDASFRPSLKAVLTNLQTLHKANCCHDDIKPDNIFISSPSLWLLGDLGNLRHVSHPWHKTRSWFRQNQWADCQLNDIRRAYKTYLSFLREVSSSDFDHQFWAGEEEWSKLYWDFLRDEAGGLGKGSEATRRAVISSQEKWGVGDEVTRQRIKEETERELICTTVPRRLWWWWEWVIFR